MGVGGWGVGGYEFVFEGVGLMMLTLQKDLVWVQSYARVQPRIVCQYVRLCACVCALVCE